MNIIGLDLSMTATGICGHDGTAFAVKTDARQGDARLARIYDDVRMVVRLAKPISLAVIEDLPRNAKGAGVTGMVQGAIRLALLHWAVPYVLIPAASLKKFATGKGNADKTAMTLAAFKRSGLEFGDDNACDAWWLRAMALDHYGHPVVTMPALNRSALDGVRWPEVAL